MAFKSVFSPEANIFRNPSGSVRRKSAPALSHTDIMNMGLSIPDELTQEQQQSITDKAIGGTLGAVGAFGNILDLPGSSVRDVLALENPLDQWMPWNWTSHEGRTTGRELLTKYGMTDPNDPDAWEGADFAGFGAEVLLDPLTYLSGFAIPLLSKGKSALSAGGRAVDKSGLFDEVAGVFERSSKFKESKRGAIEVGDEAAKTTAKNVEDKLSVGFREARPNVTPRMMLEDPVLKARYGATELHERMMEGFGGSLPDWKVFEDKILKSDPGVLTDVEKTGIINKLDEVEEALKGMSEKELRELAEDSLKMKLDNRSTDDIVNEIKKRLIPDDLRGSLDESLGGSVRVALPFSAGGTIHSPFGGRVSRRIDQFERAMGNTSVGKLISGGFDYAAMGVGGAGQAVARMATKLMDPRSREVAEHMAEQYKRFDKARKVVESNVYRDDGTKMGMLEVLGHKPSTGVILKDIQDGTSRELLGGDFIKLGKTRQKAQVIGPHEYQVAGEKQSGVLAQFLDRTSGQYVTRFVKDSELENASILSGVHTPSGWAEDSLEQALQTFIRASKEVGFDEALEHIKIRDIYGEGGRLQSGRTYAEAMGFDKGKARAEIKEVIDHLNDAESKFKSRMLEKGVDIGEVSKTRFHYASRSVTSRVGSIIEKEGNWTTRFGPDIELEERVFGGRPKVKVSSETPGDRRLLESHNSQSAKQGRDPAIANLPVFVIERMLADKHFKADYFNKVVEKVGSEEKAVAVAVDHLLSETGEYRKWIDNAVDIGRGNASRRELDGLLDKNNMSFDDIWSLGEELKVIREMGEPGAQAAFRKRLSDNELTAVNKWLNVEAFEDVERKWLAQKLYNSHHDTPGFIQHYRDRAGGWSGPMYTRDYLLNQQNYFKELTRIESLHDASLMALANSIKYAARSSDSHLYGGKYTLGNALKKMGHSLEESRVGDDLNEVVRTEMIPQKSLEHIRKLMDDDIYNLATHGGESKLLDFSIDKELFEGLVQTKKVLTNPEWKKAFHQFWDRATAVFKGNVTLPFPSFANRNWLSGQFVNVSSGDIRTPADFLLYMKEYFKAVVMGRNPTEAASREFLTQLRTQSVLGNKHLDDVEYVGNFAAVFSGRMGEKASPKSLVGMWNKQGRAELSEEAEDFLASNPAMWKRLVGGDQTKEVAGMRWHDKIALKKWREWVAQGSRWNQTVEYLNRGPMYSYLIKKGYSKTEAARRVRELQFDYGRLTEFEKGYMRRAVPFYAFTRNMTPLFFDTIADKPGGLLAQTIRASREGTETGEVLPRHVTAQTAIPVPSWLSEGQEEGAKTWLTKFGLAHEDPLSYFQHFGEGLGPGARGLAMQIGSRLNPMAKFPIESFLSQSLYQTGAGGYGRDVSEMNPTVAQLAQNIKQGGGFIPSWYSPQEEKPEPFGGSMVEHALGNLPFSRVTSTARQVFDPRKPILQKLAGLGIGAGMTTVSPYQQRRARQEALNQLMKGTDFAEEFSQVYMDKEKLLKRRQDARIPFGGELSSLPGEFSFPAMLISEQKRMNRAGKDAKAAARERREQKFSDYYQS